MTTAYLFDNIPVRQLDNNGNPVAGALLHTWIAGTTTNLATYTDATATTPLPNPIVADAQGFFPQVWGIASAYDMSCRKADDISVLWPALSVNPGAFVLSVTTLQSSLAAQTGDTLIGHKSPVTGASATTVAKKLGFITIDIVADFSADPTAFSDVGAPLNAAVTAAQALLSAAAGAGVIITAPTGSKFKFTTALNLSNAAGVIFAFDGCAFIGDIDMATWTTAVSNMQWRGGRFDSPAHTGRAFVGSTSVYLNGCSITGVTFSQSLAACIVATPINCDLGTGNFFGAPSAIGVGATHRHLVLVGNPGAGTAVNNNTLGQSGSGRKTTFNGATAATPAIVIQNGTGNVIAGDIEGNAGTAVQLTDAGVTTFYQPHIEGNGGQYQVVAQCVGADPNYYNRAINFFGGKIVPNSGANTAAFFLDANSLNLNLYGVDGVGVTAGLTVTNSSAGLNKGIRNFSGCNFTGTFSLVGIVSANSGSAGSTGFRVIDEGTGSVAFSIDPTTGATSFGLLSASNYNSTTATAANAVWLSNGLAARSTSAEKYKNVLGPLDGIDLALLTPIRYLSLCPDDDPTVEHWGFNANEADRNGIKPLVSYGAAGEVEGFAYERATAVLWANLAKLEADFEAYKADHP